MKINFDSICFCGAESSGKTTLVSQLESVLEIPALKSVARSILAEMHLPYPPTAMDQQSLIIEFQERVLAQRIALEQEFRPEITFPLGANSREAKPFIADRSGLDNYAYALACLASNSGVQEWLAQYKKRCIAQVEQYDFIFVVPAGKFEIVADGVRNVLPFFAEMIHYIISSALRETDLAGHVIEAVDPAERIEEVLSVLYSYNLILRSSDSTFCAYK